jgi:hypothetical protein
MAVFREIGTAAGLATGMDRRIFDVNGRIEPFE